MSTLSSLRQHAAALRRATRVRLMALLARRSSLWTSWAPSSTSRSRSVSTHLGKLREAGLLRDRRRRRLHLLRPRTTATCPRRGRCGRCVAREVNDEVLAVTGAAATRGKARPRTNAWPDAVAGQMERHYSPGRTWEAPARGLFGLVQLGDVLDAGSGDGAMAQLLAPRARSVTCLDRDAQMVAAARARLAPRRQRALGDLLDSRSTPPRSTRSCCSTC